MTEDLHQKLMNEAYDRFKPGMSLQDFWDQLDAKERVAVFLGNLNYQVENGGFSQWHGNGYATEESVGVILRTCLRMNTEAAHKVHELVSTAYRLHKNNEGKWDENEDFITHADELDQEYYGINEQFIKDVESYLEKM